MEFKGTKSPWNQNGINGVHNLKGNCVAISEGTTKEEKKANALLISKAPEMLEMLNEVCENLALQLDRLGVCGEGDGKGRKADADSYGGTELLYRAKQLIKEATII